MIAPEIWIPDRELYRPRFSPWLGGGEFGEILERIKPYTLVSEASCHTLYTLALQALRLGGEIWECGVLRGGTAMLLAEVKMRHRRDALKIRLFDTFDGSSAALDPRFDVPYEKRDDRGEEELADATVERVAERLASYPEIHLHPGLIPATFTGLEEAPIALAHVDVNLYQSVLDCCAFLYERLMPGGFLIFDDYGYSSCPGTRRAVDRFFHDKPEVPLVSPTAQALVFKLPERSPGE